MLSRLEVIAFTAFTAFASIGTTSRAGHPKPGKA